MRGVPPAISSARTRLRAGLEGRGRPLSSTSWAAKANASRRRRSTSKGHRRLTASGMANGTIPLVETKLHAPRRRGVVAAAAAARPPRSPEADPALTLVSAAAGFGKTTLVAEWFADGPATAWLSLDRRDNDPTLFWTYVVAALQAVSPDAGAAARRASTPLSRRSMPSSPRCSTTCRPSPTTSCWCSTTTTSSSRRTIHESMAFLLEHLPPQVHLVIASRADPPLPLARLRARGELLEVRAADLRFTADEAAAYLNDAMGLTLDADGRRGARRPHRGMDRRAAARRPLDAGPRRHRRVHRRASPATTASSSTTSSGRCSTARATRCGRFLLETSILEPAHRAALRCRHRPDAAAGRCSSSSSGPTSSSSRSTTGAAGTATTTSSPTCSGPACWTSTPRWSRELHRRASDWYEAHGDRAEAIGHAMAGEHFERAAQLIELAAPPDAAGTARRPRSGGGSKHCPARSSATGPVLTIRLVGRTDGDRRPQPGSSRCSSWWSRRWQPSAAADPIVFDDEEFARLPAQLAMYRAALALLAGDFDGNDRPRHPGARSGRAHRPPPPRRGARAARASPTGPPATSKRRSAATPKPSRSFIAAEYLPDMLGCSLALADIQIAPGPARRRDADLRVRAPMDGGAPRAAGRGRHARRAERGAHRAQRPRRRRPPPRR